MAGPSPYSSIEGYHFGNLGYALSEVVKHAQARGYAVSFSWHVVNVAYSLVGSFSRNRTEIQARIANHPRLEKGPEDKAPLWFDPAIDIVFPRDGPAAGVAGFEDLETQIEAARRTIDKHAASA